MSRSEPVVPESGNRLVHVQERVHHLFKMARDLYGVDLSRAVISFRLRGRVAGRAQRHPDGKLRLLFNEGMINSPSWGVLYTDTIPHEVAHLITYERPELGSGHDDGWRAICRRLGGTGNRTHSELIPFARGNTWKYTTSNGHLTVVSEKIHADIQSGSIYKMNPRDKGILHRHCSHELYAVRGRIVAP